MGLVRIALDTASFSTLLSIMTGSYSLKILRSTSVIQGDSWEACPGVPPLGINHREVATFDVGVSRDQRQILHDALRSQDPVEWVSVPLREVADRKGMFGASVRREETGTGPVYLFLGLPGGLNVASRPSSLAVFFTQSRLP